MVDLNCAHANAHASSIVWCYSSRTRRVYEGATTWNRAHRRRLAAQIFEQPAAEPAFIDLPAAVDGLTTRRDALDERLARRAQDERIWPTVARLRAFGGIDTLTALLLHSSFRATGGASPLTSSSVVPGGS